MIELNAEWFSALAKAAIDLGKALGDDEHKHLASNALCALSAQADVIADLIDTGAFDLTCKHRLASCAATRESTRTIGRHFSLMQSSMPIPFCPFLLGG